MENPPILAERTAHLSSLRTGGATFMISDLVRMECLVGPLKSGECRCGEGLSCVFLRRIGMQVVPITPAVCDRAASIRATTSLKPMDALQLAAAVEHGADVFSRQ